MLWAKAKQMNHHRAEGSYSYAELVWLELLLSVAYQ